MKRMQACGNLLLQYIRKGLLICHKIQKQVKILLGMGCGPGFIGIIKFQQRIFLQLLFNPGFQLLIVHFQYFQILLLPNG